MISPQKLFLKCINFAVYPQMDENKKLAIQIASFDGMASLLAFIFYFFYSLNSQTFPLAYFHFFATVIGTYGLILLRQRSYNSGRILIYFVGLVETYLSVDGVYPNSGFEFYYFPTVIVPFLVFTPEEYKKSIALSLCGFGTFLFQLYTGPGVFSPLILVSTMDKIVTIAILFTYVIGLFSVSRWQTNSAQKKIETQQSELIHISNIAALGEMSGGVAHEINNPLQILMNQVSILRKKYHASQLSRETFDEQLDSMENTILRISRLVKSLKNLSRNVSDDNPTLFPVSQAIEDMMSVSSQKLKHLGIKLTVNGNTQTRVKGHVVQLSQVLINLLNNSVDAIDEVSEQRWIKIEIEQKVSLIIITFTDSGPGIPPEIAQKMMQPFFTTKPPGRGTGLGLSISRSMIEKNGGKLYLDSTSPATKFVIELPAPNLV